MKRPRMSEEDMAKAKMEARRRMRLGTSDAVVKAKERQESAGFNSNRDPGQPDLSRARVDASPAHRHQQHDRQAAEAAKQQFGAQRQEQFGASGPQPIPSEIAHDATIRKNETGNKNSGKQFIDAVNENGMRVHRYSLDGRGDVVMGKATPQIEGRKTPGMPQHIGDYKGRVPQQEQSLLQRTMLQAGRQSYEQPHVGNAPAGPQDPNAMALKQLAAKRKQLKRVPGGVTAGL